MRSVASAAAVAASIGVAEAFCGSCSSCAAFGSVTGAFCGSSCSRCRVRSSASVTFIRASGDLCGYPQFCEPHFPTAFDFMFKLDFGIYPNQRLYDSARAES